MKERRCPVCGSTNTIQSNVTPNGGNIYVAEDMVASTEFADSINRYKCDNGHTFYISEEDDK